MPASVRYGLLLVLPVLAGAFTLEGALAADPLRVVEEEADAVVFSGDRLLARYRHVPSPQKPFLIELYSPAGVQILRDAPADHLHHHALMFAVGVDGVDFWAEWEGTGSQESRRFAAAVREDEERPRAVLRQRLSWRGPEEGPELARESRRIVVHGGDLPATLLTWHSELAVPPGDAAGGEPRQMVLFGDHYFGLGMRFVAAMDECGRFFHPGDDPGEVVRGSERLTAARWMAYAAAVDGKPVTVALFDHPENPRHPARMFTMCPFAYLSATLNLHEESLTVEGGEPLRLRYGVALWDGHPEADDVEALYRQWLGE